MARIAWCVALGAAVALFGAESRCIELDESPAEPGTWGYRPGPGETVPITPPPFSWRPEKKARGYALQIARDREFADAAYEVGDTPWSAHCPSKTLAAGAYYWRFAALDKNGAQSKWSQVRTFNVPEGAVAFPMPPLEELQRRLPEEHPRLFLRPEELPRFRSMAKGPLAKHWSNTLASAEKILRDPPDTTEPPKYPEGTEYKSEQWKKIWWGNRVRAVAVANGAATLAFAYMLSGEAKYGEGAHDLVMALCDWDPKGSTNYRYNDEAAMPLLYYPSRAYTWAHDVFNDEERERIRAMMAARGRDCFNHLDRSPHLWRPYGSHSNRAWHWLGEVAIAFQDELPDAPKWLDFAMTVFYTCYPVWGVADGGWHEGTAYWNSYTGRFMYWVLISQAAFDIDPFDKPFYKRAGYYGLYCLPPGTTTGGFGDLASRTDSKRVAPLMGSLAAGARNPHWQWYAEEHGVDTTRGYAGFIQSLRSEGLEGAEPAM